MKIKIIYENFMDPRIHFIFIRIAIGFGVQKRPKQCDSRNFVFSQFSSKTVLIYYKRVFFDLEDLTNKPKNVIDKDNVSTSDASVSGRVQHMHHTCLSVCVEALKVIHTLHSSLLTA